MVLDVDARDQVERISQSRTFRNSDVLRQLFSYLARASLAGKADELKEYTVAVDALGKPSSYDPRQESAVRMQVARLRQKLAEYYRTEGRNDPVVVDLPKGGFTVLFEPRTIPPEDTVIPEPQIEPVSAPSGWHRRETILAGALVAALASTGFFAVRNWQHDKQIKEAAAASDVPWTPEIQQFWQPLLSSNRPLVICIATPLSVLIPGFGFVRDFSVNDWEDVAKSKEINALKQALHAPTLQPTYGYTGVGTANAALLLGQFLGARQKSVVMTRSNLLSLPELMEENVVFLGPLTGAREIHALPIEQEILLEPNGIRNLHPRPGEPAFIPEGPGARGPQDLDTYSLISRVPGLRGKGEILSLSGNQISSVMAGAQALTDPTVAKMLISRMRTSSGTLPRYFQVVLRVRSMDGVPTEISYVFHRTLSASSTSKPQTAGQ